MTFSDTYFQHTRTLRRLDGQGLRTEVDEFGHFATKFDSGASAVDFLHGIRGLRAARQFHFRAEVDGRPVIFGFNRKHTDFTQFTNWFQRHIEATDTIEAQLDQSKLRWQSHLARSRAEQDDPMSGRLYSAAVTIRSQSVESGELVDLMARFDSTVDDLEVDRAIEFLNANSVHVGKMIDPPRFGTISPI